MDAGLDDVKQKRRTLYFHSQGEGLVLYLQITVIVNVNPYVMYSTSTTYLLQYMYFSYLTVYKNIVLGFSNHNIKYNTITIQ